MFSVVQYAVHPESLAPLGIILARLVRGRRFPRGTGVILGVPLGLDDEQEAGIGRRCDDEFRRSLPTLARLACGAKQPLYRIDLTALLFDHDVGPVIEVAVFTKGIADKILG